MFEKIITYCRDHIVTVPARIKSLVLFQSTFEHGVGVDLAFIHTAQLNKK